MQRQTAGDLPFPFGRFHLQTGWKESRSVFFMGQLPLDLGDRHGFTADIPGWRFFEAQLGDAYHIGVCMRDTDPDKKGAAG